MKELRLPLDFSPTLFKIINWYYIISEKRVDGGVKVVRLDQMRRILQQTLLVIKVYNWPDSYYMLQSTLVQENSPKNVQNKSLYQDF